MDRPPALSYDDLRGRPSNRTLVLILSGVLALFFLIAVLFVYGSASVTTRAPSGLRQVGPTPSTAPTTRHFP